MRIGWHYSSHRFYSYQNDPIEELKKRIATLMTEDRFIVVPFSKKKATNEFPCIISIVIKDFLKIKCLITAVDIMKKNYLLHSAQE